MISTPRDTNAAAPRILNAFTVDVEDYFQVCAFEKHIRRSQWDQFESRVVQNTHRVLALLERHEVRATFFVLGWVADRYPKLVRDIHAAGHDIGSHGYWHRLIYTQTPDEFRSDLRQARGLLEDIIGEPVVSYRAPSFSITEKSLWALKVLVEEGFRYDSSIFPVHHDNYGIPNAKRFPHLIGDNGSSLWEFPPTVHRLWKLNIPVAGGGYFRLYPARLSMRWLGAVNRRYNQPFIFYIHPWELDSDQPRLPCSRRSRFRHYQNLATTASKLHLLLAGFRFGTVSEALIEAKPEDTSRIGMKYSETIVF